MELQFSISSEEMAALPPLAADRQPHHGVHTSHPSEYHYIITVEHPHGTMWLVRRLINRIVENWQKITKSETKTTYYLLADRPRLTDLEKFKTVSPNISWLSPFRPGVVGLVGKLTGEKRPPKAGEWYLSGNKPPIYLAANDFTDAYQIAILITIRTTLTTTEIQ